jgi:hypothetical protein
VEKKKNLLAMPGIEPWSLPLCVSMSQRFLMVTG